MTSGRLFARADFTGTPSLYIIGIPVIFIDEDVKLVKIRGEWGLCHGIGIYAQGIIDFITRITWSPHNLLSKSFDNVQNIDVCAQAEATRILPAAAKLHDGESSG